MKKRLLITVSVLFLLAGCGSNDGAGADTEHENQQTTAEMLASTEITNATQGYEDTEGMPEESTPSGFIGIYKDTEGSTESELPEAPNLYGMIFEDWTPQKTQYCMENTDVYFEPSFTALSIGLLSINDVVEVTGWVDNKSELYPPYDKTENPTDINWVRIDYDGQIGYIPEDYIFSVKRDTSVEMNPFAANYPLVGGGGAGFVTPYSTTEWLYVYGACDVDLRFSLNPFGCELVEIYDGTDKNVIATITDTSIHFEPTGNAYCINTSGANGAYYIYEIYYNDGLAYIDSENIIEE